MISVAGWNRQLNRARRHRSYPLVNPNGKDGNSDKSPGYEEKSSNGTGQPNGNGSISVQNGSGAEATGFSGVATQMMDRADQKMPTLSVNARRKFFHALAVVMFVPGIATDVSNHTLTLNGV